MRACARASVCMHVCFSYPKKVRKERGEVRQEGTL